MPNLNSWIEAQLKRGHSREAIKKQLLKRGYSRKAVAEVDKIAVKRKNFDFSGHFVLALVIMGIIISIGLFFNIETEVEEQPQVEKSAEKQTLVVQEPEKVRQMISGILIEITDDEFVIEGFGQIRRISYANPITDITLLKREQDGSLTKVNLYEVEYGTQVTIISAMEDNESIVRRVLVNT